MDQIRTCEYIISLIRALLKEEQPSEKPEDISFEDVYEMAKKHHILNMCLYAIEKLQKQPDEKLLNEWKRQRDIAAVQSAVQLSERNKILGRFKQEGIACLPLKGCLLKEMYPKPEYREMADLDILIHANDVEKTSFILCDLGYEFLHNGEVHNQYFKSPFVTVEIHKELFGTDIQRKFELKRSGIDIGCNPWKYAILESSTKMYYFEWEDFYIYLILHLYKHFDGVGVGIRQFVDIWIFLNSHQINKEKVFNALQNNNDILAFCKNTESLVSAWFSDSSLNEELKDMENYIFTSGAYGNMYNNVDTKLNTLQKSNSKEIAEILYFLRRSFPSLKYLQISYPILEDYPILLPVIWIYRLCTKLSNKDSKARREVAAFLRYIKNKKSL